MLAAVLLFANTPTHLTDEWTNKEVFLYVLGGVGAALLLVVPLVWKAAEAAGRRAAPDDERAKALAAERDTARGQAATLEDTLAAVRQQVQGLEQDAAGLRAERDQLRPQLERTTGERDQARAAFAKGRDAYKDLHEQATASIATLKGQRDQARAALAAAVAQRDQARADHAAAVVESERAQELLKQATAERDIAKEAAVSEARRIQRAVAQGGPTWNEKVLQKWFVEFDRLDRGVRTTPVISLLNLKGGVGKTTTTANLGAALARLGWRVLLVDLDLQGSLTSLFLKEEEQARLHKEQRLLGNFLDRAFDAEFPHITDFTVPGLGDARCDLVPTTDHMAYAESSLTVRWYLREGRRDPRFLLRRELHRKRVTNEYDVVLLDCPPLINVSCVNALAASDYVLTPVLPSKQSTDRVVTMLGRLRDLRENLNPDLRMLGFFASRTTRPGGLTSGEETRMAQLEEQCKDSWAAATCLKANVPQSVSVRNSEDARRPIGPGDPMCAVYDQLAREIAARLPNFCRPAAEPEEAKL